MTDLDCGMIDNQTFLQLLVGIVHLTNGIPGVLLLMSSIEYNCITSATLQAHVKHLKS